MATRYVELRKSAARGTDSLAADLMRHLHTRQHLGKTVVICDQSIAMLSAARKQWLKLSRTIQKQRASTLNADKILKFTHTITHMQHMQFTAKVPIEHPEADVYFLEPHELTVMPLHCWNVYLTATLSAEGVAPMISQLPAQALIIDYVHTLPWQKLGLEPKSALEERVGAAWEQVQQFLETYTIDISAVNKAEAHSIERMDDALDTLLGISHQFLQVAGEFQRSLELARPLRIGKKARENYDALILLAHRVQALSPGAFTQHFLEAYNEDDTFFLYDPAKKYLAWTGEGLAEAIARHLAADRKYLARALQFMAHNDYMGRSLRPSAYPSALLAKCTTSHKNTNHTY